MGGSCLPINTLISNTTGTSSSAMPVVAVLLSPAIKLVSSLCSVDNWQYIRKKGLDEHVSNVTIHAITPTHNIVLVQPRIPAHAKSIGDWRCRRCSSELYIVRSENRICRFCGESSYYEPDTLLNSKTLPVRQYNVNSAKRVSHFKNLLQRIQGKERCSINAQDLLGIELRIKMYPDSMTSFQKVRQAMKEMGLQRYYNHVYYVIRQIYGVPLVEFRKINEARLLALFLRIQQPFQKVQEGRTNMLSYQFLIKKFCELLGYSLHQYIPHLKSRLNLQRQDMIWERVCDELGIPYYPSV